MNNNQENKNELEKLFITKDNKLDMEKLEKLALPFRKMKYNLKVFKEDFKDIDNKNIAIIKSQIGDVKIDVKSQFYKLSRWKENRTKLAGVIKQTIENPLFIVKQNEATKYYAVYKDDKKLIDIISVTENKNGTNILKSNYQPFKKDTIKSLIHKNNDIEFVRKTTHTHTRSYGTEPLKKMGNHVVSKSIIPNKNNNVNSKVDKIRKRIQEKNKLNKDNQNIRRK